MKILKERQEQKILNNNESTTTLTKGTKLKKSKSQNEVLQTSITDKGRQIERRELNKINLIFLIIKDDHHDDQVSAV